MRPWIMNTLVDREADLVKLDILLNGESVDALSLIVHRGKSYEWGRKVCSKLRELIPRQMFEVVFRLRLVQRLFLNRLYKR